MKTIYRLDKNWRLQDNGDDIYTLIGTQRVELPIEVLLQLIWQMDQLCREPVREKLGSARRGRSAGPKPLKTP